MREDIKTLDSLIQKHLSVFSQNNLYNASAEHFIETGTASGSFREALHTMMMEFAQFKKFTSDTPLPSGLFNGMTAEQLLEWLDKRCDFNGHQKDYVHMILIKLIKSKITAPDDTPPVCSTCGEAKDSTSPSAAFCSNSFHFPYTPPVVKDNTLPEKPDFDRIAKLKYDTEHSRPDDGNEMRAYRDGLKDGYNAAHSKLQEKEEEIERLKSHVKELEEHLLEGHNCGFMKVKQMAEQNQSNPNPDELI